jgi:hypothetical protein
MEESVENLSLIAHFAPASSAGLRPKLLWQYFGGVKDVAGQNVPHGLGVKRFACERTHAHLSRVESGRWVMGELQGWGEIWGFMCWKSDEPTEPRMSNCKGHKPEWGRYIGRYSSGCICSLY